METIKIDCTYEERTSKDNSKKFKCLVIHFPDSEYEKLVFLTIPEMVLIEEKSKKNPNFTSKS